MGTVEATNIMLSIIALASVVQVALLVGAAVIAARAFTSMQAQMHEVSDRVERMASPVLAKADRAMDQVSLAAAAVQDAKHRADMAVESARQATGRAIAIASGPALSATAAVASLALGVLRRRRQRRTAQAALSMAK